VFLKELMSLYFRLDVIFGSHDSKNVLLFRTFLSVYAVVSLREWKSSEDFVPLQSGGIFFGVRKIGRACSTHGEKRNAYKVLVGRPERKIPLGRPRRRWEDNITMDLREIGWGGMDWINLAQGSDQWKALVNTVMYLRVP
jgi:hypothetical protein